VTGVDDRRDGAPWWASGVDDLDDLVDPLRAHQRARAGADDGGGGGPADRADGDAGTWSDPGSRGAWDDPDAATRERVVRSALEDALEIVAALVRAAARRAGRQEGPARSAAGRDQGHDPACRGCPWCTLVRAVGDSRPEVTEHLEQAARHLVQAARAWVDAAEQRTGSWERIPLDDDDEEQQ
jgi:hypothetical protein